MGIHKEYGNLRMLMQFFVLAVVLCCSCSKNEPVQEDVAIDFGAVVPSIAPVTRLQPDANVFETSDKMGVYGYLVHNGTYGTADVTDYSSPYINNGEIVYCGEQDSRSLWHFNPARYWPNMGYKAIKFYAYWPYPAPGADSPGITLVEHRGNYPYFNYKSDVAGGAKNEDFLVAQASGWREIVDLKFKRPLAKVTVEVTYEDFIGTMGVDFNMPVISSGRFDYDASGAEDGDGWNLEGASTEHLKLKYTGVINGDSKGTYAVVGTSYLIPQVIEKFSVIWNYHKEAKYSSEVSGVLVLEAGKSYTIKLDIQKDHVIRVVTEVEGGTEVQKWFTITNENEI